MSETSPAEAPVSLDEGAPGLRIVLFGLPEAGKTSLLGALAQCAQTQQHLLHGQLAEQSHRLEELRQLLYYHQPRRTGEQVVSYPLVYHPYATAREQQNGKGPHQDVILIDCDGQAANDLVRRRKVLDEKSPKGTLARAVLQADTLVLALDASSSEVQLDDDFEAFGQFLRNIQRQRGQSVEVAGLPVFLVLTKCDLLAQPEDTSLDWIERIEQRKREVNELFTKFLETEEKKHGPQRQIFGQLGLHCWATAVRRPALIGKPAQAREPYGVAELFRQCLTEANQFRRRRQQAGRRLFWTTGVAGGTIVTMVVLALSLFIGGGGPPRTDLERKIEVFQLRDRNTPAERLHAGLDALRRKEEQLQKFKDDPGFASLSPVKQMYIEDRLGEITDYLNYVNQLRETRHPADVQIRNEKTLEELRQTLLKLKPQEIWKGTDAYNHYQERLHDVNLLRAAVESARRWYQDKADQALDLASFSEVKKYRPGPAWFSEASDLLDPARQAPFKENDRIPGSRSLTYAAPLAFDEVVEDRLAWERQKKQLVAVRNLCTALGLAGNVEDSRLPPVLAIPSGASVASSAARVMELRKYYPAFESEFVIDPRWPEAVREEVSQAARTYYQHLLGPAQQLVRDKLGPGDEETKERWDRVREWLKAPTKLQDWRVLAQTLARLHPHREPLDPVTDLADFLAAGSFPIDIRTLTLQIPQTLRVEVPPSRPTKKTVLTIYPQDQPALEFELDNDLTRRDDRKRVLQLTFKQAGDRSFSYRPGDRLTARLPLRDGQAFGWVNNRSQFFQMERLIREPRLYQADQDADNPRTGSPAEGVRLTIIDPPPGKQRKAPEVPDLLPNVAGR